MPRRVFASRLPVEDTPLREGRVASGRIRLAETARNRMFRGRKRMSCTLIGSFPIFLPRITPLVASRM